MKANKCAAASSALLGAMRHNISYLAATFTLRNVSIAAAITIQSQVLAFAQSELGEDPSETIRKLPRNLVVVAPTYPRDALEKGIEGEVVLEFGLSEDGHARDIAIIKSEPPGIFASALLSVLPDWLFLPDFELMCNFRAARSRQQVFFELKDGKAAFSFLPLIDVEKEKDIVNADSIRSTGSLAPDIGETRLPAQTTKQARLRYKSAPVVSYPKEAKIADSQAFIVSRFEVNAVGKIENIDFPFTAAKSPKKSYFTRAIRRVLKELEMETLDGKQPGRRFTVCQEFTFFLY